MESFCVVLGVCALFGFIIGAGKRQPLAGALLGALLGPLGLLVVLMSGAKGQTCSHCRATGLDPAATVCRHCSRQLTDTPN